MPGDSNTPVDLPSNASTQLNLFRWSREHRFAFFATTVFGACVGLVLGLRRLDPSLAQNYYWLWLALWVGSAGVLGAAAGFVFQHLRRNEPK